MLNIDYYMRDLRKHAIQEYDEVHQIEVKLVSQEEKLEKPEQNDFLNQRYGFTPSVATTTSHGNSPGWDQEVNDTQQPSDELFDLSLLDAKEKKKLKKK